MRTRMARLAIVLPVVPLMFMTSVPLVVMVRTAAGMMLAHGLAELKAERVRDLAPSHAPGAKLEDAWLAGVAMERLAQLLARRIVDTASLQAFSRERQRDPAIARAQFVERRPAAAMRRR